MQIYESKPSDREGERIEAIVDEAITATASTGGNSRRTGRDSEKAAYYKKAFQIATGLAAAETLALALLVIL